ncbi:MAG: diguanylate cyclase [Oscillatoria sp. PMC 1076.18]|nr:diguanylate cyclase [Oscillatoria sp. PMC 1076.18]
MDSHSLKILLIEDNLAETELIEELLSEVDSELSFELISFNRLEAGLDYLSQQDGNSGLIEVILLDLALPDSKGLETIAEVKAKAPQIPIVVLTILDDETVALEAVRQGAQDYLVKGNFDGELLARAMRYAIERQMDLIALKQQADREKLLGKISERIRQSLDLKEILEATVAEVRQFLNAERVLVCRTQSHNSGIVVVKSVASCDRPLWNPEVAAALNIVVQKSSDSEVIQFPQNTGEVDAEMDLIANSLLKSLLTVPIWQREPQPKSRNGKLGESFLWGMLVAQHYNNSREWQEWEISFLEHLATQVAIAIQQSELYRQLEIANERLREIANLDSLTGVANRRQFNQVLNREWRRLARDGQPLSLIICDIDYFKKYNDHYGHPAGDKALKKVSGAIAQAAQRAADLAARYGGEEFVVILPNTDDCGAKAVAEKIRAAVKAVRIPHAQSTVSEYVTLSIGVATTIPISSQSPQALIKAADTALYEAKAQGRDRLIQVML